MLGAVFPAAPTPAPWKVLPSIPAILPQIYVATVNGGVWVTNNASTATPGNMTWTALTDQEPSLATGTIAFSPLDGTNRTLFVGTGTLSNLTGAGGPAVGIYRTTDGGTTWSNFPVSAANEPRIKTVLPANINEAVSPAVQEMVLAAGFDGNGGLFQSDNNGQTFHVLGGADGLPAGQVSQVIEDPNNADRFYAALPGSGIYRGDFNTVTDVIAWTAENTNIPAGNIGTSANIQITAISAGGGNSLLYVGLANGPSGITSVLTGVFTSTLAGNSATANNWTSIGTPAGFNAWQLDGSGFSMTIDTGNGTSLYIAGLGNSPIFRYDTGPASYTNISTSNGTTPHADAHNLVMLDTTHLIESNDGGIFVLSNPTAAPGATATWVSFIGSTTNGLALGDAELHDATYDSISNRIIGGFQDNGSNYQTTGTPIVWTGIQGNDGGDNAVDDLTLAGTSDSIRYFEDQSYTNLTRQEFDSGNNTVGAAVGIIPPAGLTNFTGGFITPIAVNSVAPTVAGQSARLVVGGSGTSPVYEANNAGTAASAAAVNWTAVPVGPGFTSVNGSSAFSPVVPSNQTIVAGGVLNGVANPDVLFVASGSLVFVRSTAGGTLTATPTAFPGGTIRTIAHRSF